MRAGTASELSTSVSDLSDSHQGTLEFCDPTITGSSAEPKIRILYVGRLLLGRGQFSGTLKVDTSRSGSTRGEMYSNVPSETEDEGPENTLVWKRNEDRSFNTLRRALAARRGNEAGWYH